MREKIIEMILEISDNNETFKNNPDIDILREEIIDSLGFLELVSTIEDTFDIELETSQIPSSVWSRVDQIAKMIEEYINAKK